MYATFAHKNTINTIVIEKKIERTYVQIHTNTSVLACKTLDTYIIYFPPEHARDKKYAHTHTRSLAHAKPVT